MIADDDKPAALFGAGLLGSVIGTFLGVMVAKHPAAVLRFLDRLCADVEVSEFDRDVRDHAWWECFSDPYPCGDGSALRHVRPVGLRPSLRLVP